MHIPHLAESIHTKLHADANEPSRASLEGKVEEARELNEGAPAKDIDQFIDYSIFYTHK